MLYRGGWTFKVAGPDADLADEYEVVEIDPRRMEAYDPPPDLVVKFANLAAPETTREERLTEAFRVAAAELVDEMLGTTGARPRGDSTIRVVEPSAMLRFLEKWGPLTLPEHERSAGQFSEPAQGVAEALSAAQNGDLAHGFRLARELYRETELGDLLGVLALQVEAMLFAGDVPRSCRECGRFFTGRRRQAVYCKDECRFKFNMRASRERARRKSSRRRKEK